MIKTLCKIIVLAILPLIPSLSISNAQYHDVEKVPDNYFASSSLDFELRNQENTVQTEPFFDLKKIKLGDASEKTIKVVNNGQIDPTYYPEFEYTGGSMAVCDAITLTAAVDTDEVYSGPLADFNLATASAALTGPADSWDFSLANNNDTASLQGDHCDFDLVFKSAGTGFSDTEKLTNSVSIAYEPELTAVYNPTAHTFSFTLSNLDNFLGFTYTLNYNTATIPDQISNTIVLTGELSKTETKFLGTCSSDVCTPQDNPHDFILNIGLVDIDNDAVTLRKEL